MVQVYDSINFESQTLLHTGFYNGFNFIDDSPTVSRSRYDNLKKDDEFTNWYISNDFLNSTNNSVISVYARFYFYNAKTGNLLVFLNNNKLTNTTESSLYYRTTLIKDTKKYTIEGNPLEVELTETTNTDYINKLNDTVETFRQEKPNYPVGNYLNDDGEYEFVEDNA